MKNEEVEISGCFHPIFDHCDYLFILAPFPTEAGGSIGLRTTRAFGYTSKGNALELYQLRLKLIESSRQKLFLEGPASTQIQHRKLASNTILDLNC